MRRWLVLVETPARLLASGLALWPVRDEIRSLSACNKYGGADRSTVTAITNTDSPAWTISHPLLPYCFRVAASWKHLVFWKDKV
jgi:hypothetical protein